MRVRLEIALLTLIMFVSAGLSAAPSGATAETRSVDIETQEVTRPDVAVSLDGQWLIFTILGHLFRVPTAGGPAEQLTFGPWFDSDPAISPGGRQVVFASDRDGESNGNLFLLDLATDELRQLTHESWAARPVWSSDGRSIAYVSYQRRGMWAEYELVAPDGVLSDVREVSLHDGAVETLTEAPGLIRATFYLSDGRLAWAVLDAAQPVSSRIETIGPNGRVSNLLHVQGVLDRVVPDKDGNGLYVRRYSNPSSGFLVPQQEEIAYVPFGGEQERSVMQLANPQPRPGFSVSNDRVYLGDRGQLWQIDGSTGERQAIRFTASITMEVYARAQPPRYEPAAPAQEGVTSVLDPRLSPDGSSLVFTAAGIIWLQPLEGGPARRLFDAEGFQWGPAAISKDGRRLAYQHSEGNRQELRVADLETGQTKTLVTVDRTGRFEPSWSPDGREIVFVGFASMRPSLFVVDVESGQRRKIVDAFPHWMPRPHFSADVTQIYFTGRNQLYRVALEGGEMEPATSLTGQHMADGTVSPDGKWLAFRRNEAIWIARMDQGQVTNDSVRRLTDDGGLNFSFAPDSRAVIYSSGATVWRHPLDGGEPRKILIDVEVPAATPVATLIRNVQVLDFDQGGFTENTSLLIQQGRIQWIGPEAGRALPSGVGIVDAGGRYAIPGLFDAHTHVATPIHFNPARDVSRMSSNVAHGVTSVRDMGSDITLAKAWTDRREALGEPVPRIFSAGAMTETVGPFFHGGSFFVKTKEEARALVRKEKRDGAIAIKSYFTLPWPLHRAIAEEAREQGIPVVAHGLTFRETVMGPVLGRASIEHQPTPIRVYEDVLRLLAETGTRWCPTIAPTGGNGILFAQQPHLLSDPKLRAFTSQGDYALAQEVELFSMLDPALIERTYIDLLTSLRQGHELGVKLLAGTDALNPNVFYGHGLQMELRHFARAGIPTLDILRLATIEAAAVVGAEDLLGSLEPGKLADIVLLDENPLDHIGNTQSIWRVIQGGRVFRSEPELVKE